MSKYGANVEKKRIHFGSIIGIFILSNIRLCSVAKSDMQRSFLSKSTSIVHYNTEKYSIMNFDVICASQGRILESMNIAIMH